VDDPEVHRNPVIQQRWLYTADKIERQPGLLSIPLANIERWLASGALGNPQPLLEWRALIEAAQSCPQGMQALLQLMRDDREEAWYLKTCSPFPGVLTKQERRQFRCAWTH
jgi:hypothetical protein